MLVASIGRTQIDRFGRVNQWTPLLCAYFLNKDEKSNKDIDVVVHCQKRGKTRL